MNRPMSWSPDPAEVRKSQIVRWMNQLGKAFDFEDPAPGIQDFIQWSQKHPGDFARQIGLCCVYEQVQPLTDHLLLLVRARIRQRLGSGCDVQAVFHGIVMYIMEKCSHC